MKQVLGAPRCALTNENHVLKIGRGTVVVPKAYPHVSSQLKVIMTKLETPEKRQNGRTYKRITSATSGRWTCLNKVTLPLSQRWYSGGGSSWCDVLRVRPTEWGTTVPARTGTVVPAIWVSVTAPCS